MQVLTGADPKAFALFLTLFISQVGHFFLLLFETGFHTDSK